MKQRNIPFSPPDITEDEITEVIDTLKSGWLTTGPKTKEFEKLISKNIGTNKSVALNSATAAMELVLRVMGIGPGDEVITTAYTYTATAAVIRHVGAKIILVDTAEDSVEMDYDKLEQMITEKTKAIIAVDVAGIICDYDKIYEIVLKNKEKFTANNNNQSILNRILIMSDSAHSFGARKDNKFSGQFADFTCFSFHAVKNLTTSEGGAVTWRNDIGFDDDELYSQFMLYSLHGQTKDALTKSQIGSWEYDIVVTGYKNNMTDISSAIGIAQLNRYPKLLNKRKKIIEMYNEGFSDLNLKTLEHYSENHASSGHLYMVRITNFNEEQRNQFIIELAKLGVASNVHYKPLPMFTAYKKLGFDIKNYPNAYNYYKNEITLPLHTKLTELDVKYIINCFMEVYNNFVDEENDV